MRLQSNVARNIESSSKLMGFELFDLLFIFIYLSMSNLLFGGTSLKIPLVWIGTSLLAILLYFLKKGQEENYLPNLLRSFAEKDIYMANCVKEKKKPYFLGEKNENDRS